MCRLCLFLHLVVHQTIDVVWEILMIFSPVTDVVWKILVVFSPIWTLDVLWVETPILTLS